MKYLSINTEVGCKTFIAATYDDLIKTKLNAVFKINYVSYLLFCHENIANVNFSVKKASCCKDGQADLPQSY